ncbi:MAG: bifunctional phosphoserine phosphatase/homoserine phosphotransferase ThrH, partial [Eggerthellaceae bacterium]|nr:bifunctional phosphoserine phosphatase/homoserine phosphotransferase ThrH [Eggerthellaceae bacterium]
VIISDTFTQFASPLMRRLGWPTILCNELVTNKRGEITGWHMRASNSKYKTVTAFQFIGYDTIAMGDSYNDIGMIQGSQAGFFFRTTDEIKKEHPEIPAYEDYDELFDVIKEALDKEYGEFGNQVSTGGGI